MTRRIVRTTLTALFLAAAAVGMGGVLGGHGDDVLAMFSGPRATALLVCALLVKTAGQLAGWGSWRAGLTALGSPLPAGQSARIYFLALLGKYIPGPVWGVLAYVRLGGAVGVGAGRMVSAYLLNTLVVLLTAAVTGLLCVPGLGAGGLWLLAASPLALAVLWRPRLLLRLMTRAARLLRREPPQETFADRSVRAAIGLETLCWAVSGLHLWLIAVLLGAPVGRALPICVGAFALATVAGALTLVVPDGAGTRELVLLGALSTVLPWAEAGAAALASRVCCTAAELLGAGGVLALTGRGQTGDGQVSDGQVGDGQVGDGRTGDGRARDGETRGGLTGDGKACGGLTRDGETRGGLAGSGKTGDGRTGGGKARGGETRGGLTGDGKACGGLARGGETRGGLTGDGKACGGLARDGETRGGLTGGGKSREGLTNGGETRDRQTGGGETRDRQTGGGETRDRQTGGGETRDGQTGGGQTDKTPVLAATRRREHEGVA
jgi:glycosyltransferase 2 family protein